MTRDARHEPEFAALNPQPEPAAPEAEQHPTVPWTFADALVAFMASLFLASLAGPALLASFPAEVANAIFFPLTLVIMALTTVGYVRLRFPGHVRDLVGGRRFRARHLLVGLGLGIVAFLFINMGIAYLVQLFVELVGGDMPTVQEGLREATQDPGLGFVVTAAAVVGAPIAEEFYFRGMLFQALRSQLAVWPGIGLSGVLFGLAHLFGVTDLDAALYTMLVLASFGMFLAWAQHRWGHLSVPIVMHLTFNAAAVGAIALAG